MKKMLFCFFLIVTVIIVSSCSSRFRPVVVLVPGNVLYDAESSWLVDVLRHEQERMGFDFRDDGSGDIEIELFSFWEFEDINDGIVISKTWYVPSSDPLRGRRNTTLELCVNGQEELISLYDLSPPFTALRVDNLSVDDHNYPLVRMTVIRFTTNNNNAEKYVQLLEDYFNNIYKSLIDEQPNVIWVTAAGDMMLGRNAGNILLGEGAASLFGKIAPILQDSDVTVANLEGPLSQRGTRAQKTFTFRFEPPRELGLSLREAGFDALLFANNHTFDFGMPAFLDTLDYLDEAGIAYLGAGRNEEEALTPFVFEKEDFTARFWGIASFPRESSGYDGSAHAAEADKAGMIVANRGGAEKLAMRFIDYEDDGINIVFFHGGVEWSSMPDRATRELYSELLEKGADIIIGTHPHIIQGFEWVDDKLIFWSLGNFVFSGMQNTGGGDEGLLIRFGFIGRQPIYIEPFVLTLSGPRVDFAEEERLEDFYRKSRALSVR